MATETSHIHYIKLEFGEGTYITKECIEGNLLWPDSHEASDDVIHEHL